MTVVAAARARLHALPAAGGHYLVVVDVLVAMALTAGGLVELAVLTYTAPVVLAVASCVVCTGSVALRRLAPFVVAVLATTAITVYQIATHDPDGSFIAPAAALIYYYAGRSAAERAAWKRLAALLGYALVASPLMDAAIGRTSLPSAVSGWPLTVVPVAAGIVVARHASLVRRLAEATASLRDEQRVRAARLLGEERNRVARELHDVVAHHVSVMVIQASGARLVVATDPLAADNALQVVERSGREALADLRRIMGVMRRSDAPDGDMSMGLAHLDQLIDRTRTSGVPVDVEVRGHLDEVPAAVDLVAYRVVQEALTNVVKHARAATARVTISVGESLVVCIVDSGAAVSAPVVPGAGHGLLGMRERVALYGGRLRTGNRSDGGFEVRVDIPLRTEPVDRQAADGDVRGNAFGSTRRIDRARRWVAAVRPWSDMLLAGCWLVALELDALTDQYRRGPLAVNVIAAAVMAVAFAWRRRAPLLFVLVVGAAAVPLSSGLTSAHATLVGFYCVSVPMFTVAAWLPRSRALAGLAFWIAGSVGVAVIGHEAVAGLTGGLVMSCLLWAAGRLWRSQRILAERVTETNLLLAAEREDRERIAIAGERARIAGELHTDVSQNVVAMVVQAAAARCETRDDPQSATAAITAIEQIGRVALSRMRDILGVLRAHHELLQVRPQPGLEQLHGMVAQFREDGRSVELHVEGDPTPLPAAVDLTTYRIVEAAIAAADRRPSRELTVVLRFCDGLVEVEASGSGLQLSARLHLTVSERAALCNGTVVPADARRAARLLVRLPIAVNEAVPV